MWLAQGDAVILTGNDSNDSNVTVYIQGLHLGLGYPRNDCQWQVDSQRQCRMTVSARARCDAKKPRATSGSAWRVAALATPALRRTAAAATWRAAGSTARPSSRASAAASARPSAAASPNRWPLSLACSLLPRSGQPRVGMAQHCSCVAGSADAGRDDCVEVDAGARR